MVTILNVNWGDVWAMAGIGIGVVFCVLLLLVFVMQLLGYTVQKVEHAGTKTTAAAATPVAAGKADSQPAAAAVPVAAASDADKAAIATALYLYFHNVHVEESHVITIHHNDLSAWHHELNQHV